MLHIKVRNFYTIYIHYTHIISLHIYKCMYLHVHKYGYIYIYISYIMKYSYSDIHIIIHML